MHLDGVHLQNQAGAGQGRVGKGQEGPSWDWPQASVNTLGGLNSRFMNQHQGAGRLSRLRNLTQDSGLRSLAQCPSVS